MKAAFVLARPIVSGTAVAEAPEAPEIFRRAV